MKSIIKHTDLITTKIAIENGFKWQIEKKSLLFSEFIEKKNYFINSIKISSSLDDLLKNKICYEFLVAACSLSKKSLSNLDKLFVDDLIKQTVDYSMLNNKNYLDNLIAKYFMICGDSLGGMMRNMIGSAAQEKLTNKIIYYLNINKISYSIKTNPKKLINQISWEDKILVFNKKPKFINKSIDFILLKCDESKKVNLENYKNYLACGELKGGIDPAGADEHWKTANFALQRIQEAFSKNNWNVPSLFFIGSAIENSMAEEIYEQITNKQLSGAANLNIDIQLDEVIEMIIKMQQ